MRLKWKSTGLLFTTSATQNGLQKSQSALKATAGGCKSLSLKALQAMRQSGQGHGDTRVIANVNFFESTASDETIGQLKSRLEKLMDIEEDFVLFFEVCERDFQKKQIFGKNIENDDKITDEDFVIL